MRLHRGLWHVEARYPDRLAIEPPHPLPYDMAAVLAGIVGAAGGVRVILRRVDGTRARWEWLAPFEASDPPRWGEEV